MRWFNRSKFLGIAVLFALTACGGGSGSDSGDAGTYVKPSNTDEGDGFGWSVSLSADGNTLAVGANTERSDATGIDGDQFDNSVRTAGAAYLFTRFVDTWTQHAYVKASNTDRKNAFGRSVSLSVDGGTLAVGAPGEDSDATGINGDQSANFEKSNYNAGAVYIY